MCVPQPEYSTSKSTKSTSGPSYCLSNSPSLGLCGQARSPCSSPSARIAQSLHSYPTSRDAKSSVSDVIREAQQWTARPLMCSPARHVAILACYRLLGADQEGTHSEERAGGGGSQHLVPLGRRLENLGLLAGLDVQFLPLKREHLTCIPV